PTAQTVLASLGPNIPTFGLSGKRASGPSASNETDDKRNQSSALPPSDPGSLAQPRLMQAALSPALQQGLESSADFGLAEEGEEHEDEMLFQPLPIVELLTDTPLSHIEIKEEQRPLFQKTHLLLSAPSALMSPEFEDGLQIENLYAAR